MRKENYAHFYCKVDDISEHLLTKKLCGVYKYEIRKIIELDFLKFQQFTENLLDYYDFITENISLMTEENKIMYCILVKAKGEKEGILVNSEGYDYPRYTAQIIYKD